MKLLRLLVAALVITCVMQVSNADTLNNKGQHPLINASENYLIGGTVDGKWTRYESLSKLMKGGERYRLYSLSAYLGQAVGTKPVLEEPGEYPYVKVKPKVTGTREVFGVYGNWNALPRVPKVQNTTQTIYRDIVRSHLQREGIKNPAVNIRQILRVDLEGDGQQEVLISATTPNPNYARIPGMKKGDYSVVLLRKVVKGKVRTIPVWGEYYPTDKINSAPNAYHIAAILDVNGDGIQEILVGWHYYEGMGTSVITVKGDKVTEVLSGGFGA